MPQVARELLLHDAQSCAEGRLRWSTEGWGLGPSTISRRRCETDWSRAKTRTYCLCEQQSSTCGPTLPPFTETTRMIKDLLHGFRESVGGSVPLNISSLSSL